MRPIGPSAARFPIGRFVAVLLAAMLAAAHARAQDRISVIDDRGRTIELLRPPVRIVSLLPSLTESICELRACDRLVGTDRFSDWPDRVRTLPKLGGLEDAQLERIVALAPDLVLAGLSARVIDRLEGLGIRVLALEVKGLFDTRRVLETIARVLGRPGAGDDLWRSIDQRIDAAASRVPSQFRGQRVYFEIAEGPYAGGESSFVGETLTRLGLRNVVPASLGPFPRLGPEFVIRSRPDLIMGSVQGVAGMPGRPGWRNLEALRERRTCAFPPGRYDILLRPGPRLAEAAEMTADCLVALGRGTR